MNSIGDVQQVNVEVRVSHWPLRVSMQQLDEMNKELWKLEVWLACFSTCCKLKLKINLDEIWSSCRGTGKHGKVMLLGTNNWLAMSKVIELIMYIPWMPYNSLTLKQQCCTLSDLSSIFRTILQAKEASRC